MKITRRQIRNLIKEEFSLLYEQTCDVEEGSCEIPQEPMTPEKEKAMKRDLARLISQAMNQGVLEADAIEESGWKDAWGDWKVWLEPGGIKESQRRMLRREIVRVIAEQGGELDGGDSAPQDDKAAAMTKMRQKAIKQLVMWLAKRKVNPSVTNAVRRNWEAREGADAFGDLAFFIVNHQSDPSWVKIQEGVLAALPQYHSSGGEPYQDGILGGLERWFDKLWTLPQSHGGYGKQLKGSSAVANP